MPRLHEPAGLAGLEGTTNQVNFKAKVELRAVCKYWDRLKDKAEQQSNREQRQMRRHLVALNQKKFDIRVNHTIDRAVQLFAENIQGNGEASNESVYSTAKAWQKSLAKIKGLNGDRVSTTTLRLVKRAEDKHWHQPATSKMRPSSIVKFPHIWSGGRMLPDRGSVVTLPSDPVHRRPLDESRRGSDPFHGTAAQQKPQFNRRVGAGRTAPPRVESLFGVTAPSKYPLPSALAKKTLDVAILASTVDAFRRGPDRARMRGSSRWASIMRKSMIGKERKGTYREDSVSDGPNEITSLMRLLTDVNTPSSFDPVSTLNCRYLRLSGNNVKELTAMCEEQGIDVGVHGHMTAQEVADYFDKANLLENERLQRTSDNVETKSLQLQSKHDISAHKARHSL